MSYAPDDGDQKGECPICGKYRKEIERGEIRPCFEWERPNNKRSNSTEEEE